MAEGTAYRNFSPWAARSLLAVIAFLVAIPAIPHAPLKIRGEREHWWDVQTGYTDADLYRDILTDFERGQGYYAAAAKEQRAHHYPTAPAQVFREPTLAWLLALLHFRGLQLAALFAIYASIIVQLYRGLTGTGKTFAVRIATLSAAITGLSIAGMSGAVYLHEVWAALLIAASLIFYRAEFWWPSVVLALLACLIRELALPFMFVMAAFALYAGRRREFVAWVAACAVFAGFFSWHLAQAAHFHKPGDLVSNGWLGLGGWNFVIATAKWNVVLHALPPPLIALAICLGVVGLAGANDERARRAACTVAGYMLAFLVVGRLDNYYWGRLYAPLLPIGWVLSPPAMRDLFERAREKLPTTAR
jgi:hypothetical protein